MQKEIQAAYAAAGELTRTMQCVAKFRSCAMSGRFPGVPNDEQPSWEAIQAAMKQPMQREAPGMKEAIAQLDNQLAGLLVCFEPIKHAMQYSYAAIGQDFELAGVSGRDVRWPLYDVGHALSGWAKQFVAVFSHERAHIALSPESKLLEELRSECPVTDAMFDQIRQRLYREESQLMRDHVQPAELQPQTAAPATDSQKRGKRKQSKAGDTNNNEILKGHLLAHHRYGSKVLNLEPTGPSKIESALSIPKSTATRFFKQLFNGHDAYKRLCSDEKALFSRLQLLAGDAVPAKHRTNSRFEATHYDDEVELD